MFDVLGDMFQGIIDFFNGILDAIGSVVDHLFAWGGFFFVLFLIWLFFFTCRCFFFHFIRKLGLYNHEHFRFYPRLPWRSALRPFLGVERWIANLAMGKKQNARWAGPIEKMCAMFKPGMVFIGRMHMFNFGWFQPIGLHTTRHLAMVAGTGSGKTTSVISMLALHRGNAFVIDPKGQITDAVFNRCGTGYREVFGKGGRAMALDPNGIIDGLKSACWNPFDELHQIEDREGPEAVPEMAAKMAEALIQQDSNTQPVFANAAREFVKALILHVYTTEDHENQTLMRVRELLTRGVQDAATQGPKAPLTPIQRLVMLMDQNTRYAAIGNAISTVKEALKRDNQGTFLSSANIQLGWLDFDNIREIMDTEGHPDFSLFDLKEKDLSLFVVAKTTDIQQTYTGWFRLLTVMSMQCFERSKRAPAHPCLFVIDEMPSLGRIEAIETAAPVMRSYGVQLLAITQDLDLLARAYPDSYGSFLGNADAIMWMGTNSQKSLEYLQDVLGGRTHDDGAERPIAYAQQLGRFMQPKRNNMIVTFNGGRPMKLKVPHYFRELPVYHYEEDDNHRAPALRRFGRWLMGGDHEDHIEARGRWPVFKRIMAWTTALPLAYLGVSLWWGLITGIGLALFGSWYVPAYLIYFIAACLTTCWMIVLPNHWSPRVTRLMKLCGIIMALPLVLSAVGSGIYWAVTGFYLDPPDGGYWIFDLVYSKDTPVMHRTYANLTIGFGLVAGFIAGLSASTAELSQARAEQQEKEARKKAAKRRGR